MGWQVIFLLAFLPYVSAGPMCKEPGMKLLLSSGTQCVPCDHGTYSLGSNIHTSCTRCSGQCSVTGMVKTGECTRTRNTPCECPAGYFWQIGGIACGEHTTCAAGKGVTRFGTTRADTVCKNCTDGTFSNTKSATDTCASHQVCPDGVREPGNASTDNICSHAPGSSRSQETTIILASVLGTCGVLILCAVIYAVIYVIDLRRRRNIPDTQLHMNNLGSEKDSSYNISNDGSSKHLNTDDPLLYKDEDSRSFDSGGGDSLINNTQATYQNEHLPDESNSPGGEQIKLTNISHLASIESIS